MGHFDSKDTMEQAEHQRMMQDHANLQGSGESYKRAPRMLLYIILGPIIFLGLIMLGLALLTGLN